ncbi:MAG: glucose-1-phosphate thymidylyltransferase [Candidatus Nealsonbacteria bacterium]|nr:glucose-1-phosphate thymidylyltransferase [Candidatus Nealsonbacteria bacterium]
MNVILFEDDKVQQLYPATIGRSASEVSCGSYRLVELADRLGDPVRALVRPHLRQTLQADLPELVAGPLRPDGPVLAVNARLLPSAGVIQRLAGMARQDRPAVFRFHDDVAAVVLGPQHALPGEDEIVGRDPASWLDPLGLDVIDADLPLLQYPHDLIRYHPAALAENLEDRLARGQYKEIADGVFAASSASLGQYVVTDTSEGPIVLEADASVGPHCFLSGPIHVGPRSRIIEHAAVKDAVALGHTCKIGGELENSIVEPYTNKQHHGFLGHSYLGSWVNLGAGTCNSDLKNTYGQVGMEYGGRRVATGMQFIGCIIGDYAKTAVNTSIFTGKTIGACTMVYGFVTTNVASFVNYARLFGQVTEAPVDVMIATQARMFARRNVPQRDCDVQLLRDMYELTRHERQLAVEPLSL